MRGVVFNLGEVVKTSRSDSRITVCFSADEAEALKREAEGARVKISRLIHDRALEKSVPSSNPVWPLVAELQRVGHALMALRDSALVLPAGELEVLIADVRKVLLQAARVLDPGCRRQ